MKIPKLQIGSITADIPIVQGGMGVRVSLSSLVSAVANQGGIGTITSIGLGDITATARGYEKTSREALISEIRKAKSLTKGHLAVNLMGVLSNVTDLIRTSVEEGIKMIVFGAGLPTKLPDIVKEEDVNLVPIISSSRVAEFIMRTWDKFYKKMPDAFILEGPLAGGHLGFSVEQLEKPDDFSLEILLPQVLESIKPYEDKYGKKIPIVTGGGIYTGQDIKRMLSMGASGVQMGTRFVCTEECDVSPEFKQSYLDATKEDIVIIKSPVGMPGRAINNKFLKDLEIQGKFKISCPYRCLTACKIETARYCIAKALLNSCFGKVDEGLIFCGQNAYRINKIVKVEELFNELIEGYNEAD
ncbi:MAG: nitronate monooxygenase [Mariniphaga sp.]|nr:nitronate monooxygenase [Mariniphaga sp.]